MSGMKRFNCYVTEKGLDKIQNTIEYLTKSRFQNRTYKTKNSVGLNNLGHTKNINSKPLK